MQKDELPLFELPKDEVESVEWMEIAKVKKLIAEHPEQVTDGLAQVINRSF